MSCASLSPRRFEGDNSVERVVLGVNKLPDDVLDEQVESTDEKEVVECGLVFRSICYKSVQADPALPFDKEEWIVPNDKGRVTSIPGLYAGFWLSTGPLGVIADTQGNAFGVGLVVASHCHGRCVSWNDWLLLDKVEVEKGAGAKPRYKLTEVEDMLQVMGK